MSSKTVGLIGLVLLAAGLAVFVYALQRDIRFEKAYTGDLRNRVVGARLIRDGRSPYFYKWKKGDPIRYYDPENFDTLKTAVMTSSPFLHLLLTPVVDLPQARISVLWLGMEYFLFIGMTFFALSLAKTDPQKRAILLLFPLFLLTNAWKEHIALGQTYICIPFIAMICFGFTYKNKNAGYFIAAGIAASCLALIRINSIFFFIPFLFLARNYSRARIAAFFIPVVLFLGWALANRQEYALWSDYGRFITEQIKVHQQLHPAIQYNEPDPHYREWEGINMQAARDLEQKEQVKIYSENGNVFVLFHAVFHRQLPVALLAVLSLSAIACLTLLFYFLNRPLQEQDLLRVAIFGFCLYMISDLFSPIYRHQYYTVQWLFPLLLAAANYRPYRKASYILLLSGLLLNCIHFTGLKMGNTIGEYLMLVSLLLISMFPARLPKPKLPQESVPASVS